MEVYIISLGLQLISLQKCLLAKTFPWTCLHQRDWNLMSEIVLIVPIDAGIGKGLLSTGPIEGQWQLLSARVRQLLMSHAWIFK